MDEKEKHAFSKWLLPQTPYWKHALTYCNQYLSDAKSMLSDIAIHRKACFVRRSSGRLDLAMDGRAKARDMRQRFHKFLNAQLRRTDLTEGKRYALLILRHAP